LHLGILLFMPLSIFSFAMITLLTVMLPGSISERIIRWVFRVQPLKPEAVASSASWRLDRIGTLGSIPIVLYLLAAHGSQLIRENEPLSTYLPHKASPLLQYPLDALRTYQGWCMFASCGNTSNPPISSLLVVIGKGEDGEKVDVLRSAVMRQYVRAPSEYRELPAHVSDELLHTYFRALTNGNTVLVSGLKRWISQHQTSGRALTFTPPYSVYERWQPLSLSLLSRPERFVQGRDLPWGREILALERPPGS
jgi:hypothetical protein